MVSCALVGTPRRIELCVTGSHEISTYDGAEQESNQFDTLSQFEVLRPIRIILIQPLQEPGIHQIIEDGLTVESEAEDEGEAFVEDRLVRYEGGEE